MDGGGLAIPLFIAFIVLKLTHVIHWSWWWITSPLWIDALGTVALLIVMAVLGVSAFGILRRFAR